jgi:hypothetical protein
MFKRETSYQLDAVIYLLDSHPPFLIRLALRFLKRRLERDIFSS